MSKTRKCLNRKSLTTNDIIREGHRAHAPTWQYNTVAVKHPAPLSSVKWVPNQKGY